MHSFLHFIYFDLTEVSLTSGSPKALRSAYWSQRKCMVIILVSFFVCLFVCCFDVCLFVFVFFSLLSSMVPATFH